MNLLKKYKWTFLFLGLIFVITFINRSYGYSIFKIAASNFKTMLGVIPPIFVLIGLLDVWVPKETMVRYMGDDSGVKGLFIALLMASMAAGPLYAAFPIAALLIKKGARLAYVIFFLSSWTSVKIPLLLFEMTSLSINFTIIHALTMTSIYLVGSILIERLLSENDKKNIMKQVIDLS